LPSSRFLSVLPLRNSKIIKNPARIMNENTDFVSFIRILFRIAKLWPVSASSFTLKGVAKRRKWVK